MRRSWDASTDDTYYFKTRYYPDPNVETQYSGPATSDAPSTILGKLVQDYVFPIMNFTRMRTQLFL